MHIRPLIAAWLALVALMAIAGLGADLIGHPRLGAAPLLAVAAASIAKARLILSRYLRLGALPGLLAGFTAASGAVIVAVAASLLLGR